MIRPARPDEAEALQAIHLRAERWRLLEDFDPHAWEAPAVPAGTLVFDLGEPVGWLAPGGEPVVDPRAQGAGVEEALREAAAGDASGPRLPEDLVADDPAAGDPSDRRT